MTKEEFETLKNFKLIEKDIKGRLITTRLHHIEPELMHRTDYAVGLVKKYYPNVIFIVVDINLGKHTFGSLHYEGEAIDGFFYDAVKKMILPLPVQYYYMTLGGFKGVGVYPEHKQPKIHGDIRDQKHLSVWYAYYGEIIKKGKKVKVQKYEYDRMKIAEVLGIWD